MASRPARSSPTVSSSPARRQQTRGGGATVLDLLQPGSFVKLRNQPRDLPPFELIRCRGGRCWVRQQAWGSAVQWEVSHRQLTTAA
jgi:hypothetical protein